MFLSAVMLKILPCNLYGVVPLRSIYGSLGNFPTLLKLLSVVLDTDYKPESSLGPLKEA
jgi:hypothetical protein